MWNACLFVLKIVRGHRSMALRVSFECGCVRKDCAVHIRTPGHQKSAQTFWNVGLEAATIAKATRHQLQICARLPWM